MRTALLIVPPQPPLKAMPIAGLHNRFDLRQHGDQIAR
jgi:hypothetical protein